MHRLQTGLLKAIQPFIYKLSIIEKDPLVVMHMQKLNKNPQKQRMNIELNQIRSILNDFRKTKYKCVQLAKSINVEMPNEQHFKNVQKTTMRKMDLLDITGLVNLKNQLVRALTDLFQIQRQLRYKKQKFDARRQIMQAEKQQIEYVRKNYVQSAIQSPRNNKSIMFQTNVRSIVSQPKKQEIQIERSKPKNKNLEIPLYRAKNQTNENKLDRISKYIASLKRNMKLNSQTLGYKWKIKEFLLQDPNYVRLRTELEKYMMREEQLDNILARAVQKGVKEYIKKSQIVESNAEYKLIKVYKNNPKKQINLNQSSPNLSSHKQHLNFSAQQPQDFTRFLQSPKGNTLQQTQIAQDLSFNSPKVQKSNGSSMVQQPSSFTFNSPLKNLSSKLQIQSKAEEDFNSIKKELEKSTESYIEMLSKINQTVQKGSEKLIQLRQKRKKKFEKDDDIWDELDKI